MDRLLLGSGTELSEGTRKAYGDRVRSLLRELEVGGGDVEEVMLNAEGYAERLEVLRTKSLSTRCNWLATLCSLFKYGESALEAAHGADRVKRAREAWQESFGRLKGAQEAEYRASGPRTAEQRENYVRMDEIRPRYEAEMCREEKERHKSKMDSQAHVLLSYMANMTPKRADLGALRVVRSEAASQEWEGNYVLLLPPFSKMVIRSHKTSKQHGSLEEALPGAMEEDVEASLRWHPREYLLTGRDGGPLSNHDYVKLLQRTTQRYFEGRRGGVNLLRHAYVSECVDFNRTPYDALEQVAKQMGHSMKMQSLVYKWTDSNIPAGAASLPSVLVRPPAMNGGGGGDADDQKARRWRCEEEGCCCELSWEEDAARQIHQTWHAALRGEAGDEDDGVEEAVDDAPGLPEGYKRHEGNCGARHGDGKSCARPYVCEHAPDVRGDGTKRLVRFKGVEETKFSCCPVEGCGARSRTEAAMRRHLEAHHAGELLCKCEDCGQAFRTCGKLLEHVRRTEHFFEMADPRGYLGDEVRVGSVLRREGIKFCWQRDVWLTPQPGGQHHDARVDFTLDTPSGGVICLEVDGEAELRGRPSRPNAHRRCKVQKELDRMREVAAVMGKSGTRPVTFVRYNVDPFTLNKITKLNPAKEKREARLLEELKKAEAYTRPLSVVYMFYDVYYDEAERRMLPSVMKREGYPDEMKANCVGVVFNAGV